MTAIAAKHRQLGRSDLSVFPVGLGLMSFSGAYGKSDDLEAIRVIHHALDRGVTLLGGFPFPICTPAHGTAYDIAGRGVANVGAARAALLLAASMAQTVTL